MRILVTGAAGFIGANLAQELLKDGHSVIGIDNFITGSKNNIEELSKNTTFKFLEADITKLTSSQKKFLNNLDQVYHLACPTGVPNLVSLAEEMLLTCSIGTRNILEIAKENNAKLVFTSSSEVYGDPEKFPQDENYTGNVDPVGIRSPYEEGKRFSESLVTMYVRKYKLNAKIVRVFNTYGPKMNLTDTRVIPAFIQQIKNGTPLTIHGDGAQRRTFCYVDDLVAGLKLVIENGDQRVYNLGGEEEITIKELAHLISELFGKELNIKTLPRPEHDHQARLPKLQLIKKLGWSPKINLKTGLTNTINLPIPAKI